MHAVSENQFGEHRAVFGPQMPRSDDLSCALISGNKTEHSLVPETGLNTGGKIWIHGNKWNNQVKLSTTLSQLIASTVWTPSGCRSSAISSCPLYITWILKGTHKHTGAELQTFSTITRTLFLWRILLVGHNSRDARSFKSLTLVLYPCDKTGQRTEGEQTWLIKRTLEHGKSICTQNPHQRKKKETRFQTKGGLFKQRRLRTNIQVLVKFLVALAANSLIHHGVLRINWEGTILERRRMMSSC